MKTIENLEDLLSSSLKTGEKILKTDVSTFTAPGENYGSVVLRIDLKIKNEKTQKGRTLNIIGKLIPEAEQVQTIFKIQQTYRNEYIFYASIAQIFDQLLKHNGISTGFDCVPAFHGGRLNLDNSKCVRSEAIILLENLKPAGYIIGNKSEGYDFETSKLVLDALAQFHAAGIAVRHLEPHTFDEKIRPFCLHFEPLERLLNGVINVVIEKLAENGFTSEERAAIRGYNYNNNDLRQKEENKIWGTIIHGDSWTNNFLIKYENDKPVHAVIVDFQICEYGTPLNDVMFYLMSSVQQEIFEESLDPLLKHYYNKLLDYLEKLGVDTQLFSKSSYEEEIRIAVEKYEYAHTIWMLCPLMHDAFKSVDVTPDVFVNWTEKHVQKVVQITRTCFKRGWLNVKK